MSQPPTEETPAPAPVATASVDELAEALRAVIAKGLPVPTW